MNILPTRAFLSRNTHCHHSRALLKTSYSKYLRYLGWCVLGVLGTLRDANMVDVSRFITMSHCDFGVRYCGYGLKFREYKIKFSSPIKLPKNSLRFASPAPTLQCSRQQIGRKCTTTACRPSLDSAGEFGNAFLRPTHSTTRNPNPLTILMQLHPSFLPVDFPPTIHFKVVIFRGCATDFYRYVPGSRSPVHNFILSRNLSHSCIASRLFDHV